MAVSNVELRVDGRNAVNQLNRVNKAANTLQGTVGKLAGAFAAIQASKFVFFKTAELETQARSLKVLTGSLGDAQKIIKELQAFGAVTPFTSSELIETAKRLKAFGFETEQIVDVTKRLGDVAGATGADLSGIATAFGQIQAKGRLQGEELLQLQERGVDLAGTLRKEYGLTGEEFQKALSKGQISAKAVSFALEKLTEQGGKYADGAIAQSDTLSGKLSTIQDGVDTLARRIGEVLSPAIKGVFDQAIQALDAVNRLLAADRMGGLNRQLGGLGIQITGGFTSEAAENAENIFNQLSAQKNRAGIKQNIAVLDRLSQQLQRIRPQSDEFNASLEALQGRIMRRRDVEDALLRSLPVETLKTVKIPELLTGTDKGKGAEGRTTAAGNEADLLKKIAEESAKRVRSLQEQTLLAAALTEEERTQFERQINIANIIENKKGLSEAQLKTELEATLALYEQQDATKALTEENEKQADAKAKAQQEEKKRAEELKNVYQGIGDTIADGVTNALKGAVDGTKSLADAATSLLNDLANQLLQVARNMLFFGNISGTLTGGSGILGSLFSGFLANGGTAMGGRSYVVGEKGPELFTPGRTGSVAPTGSFGGANIVVNVDASGSSVQGDSQSASQLGKAIGAAVQAELIKQKRPGGLLTR